MRGGVTDAGQPNKQRTVKIELISQWKLEAEFRNYGTFESLKSVCVRINILNFWYVKEKFPQYIAPPQLRTINNDG